MFPQKIHQAVGNIKKGTETEIVRNRYRQMDVAQKARKSYEQFAIKEKSKDEIDSQTE